MIAGPLLAPYYNYFSLTGVVVAFVRQKWLMILLIERLVDFVRARRRIQEN